MRFFTLAAVIASTVLIGTGCAEDPTGTVLIEYQVGQPGDSCSADHHIVQLEFRLHPAEGDDIVVREHCQDGRSTVMIADVPVNSYTLTIQGLDINEVATWDSDPVSLNVTEGLVTETTLIRLSPMPASLFVQWRFANGLSCALNEVSDVLVGYYFNGTFYDDAIVPCEDSQATVSDVIGDEIDVRIRAVDTNTGDYTFYYDTDQGLSMTAGTVTELDYTQVILRPCVEDCTP